MSVRFRLWGVPRVSEDHLTARREQILAAAQRCFKRNGLHRTTMQDLIREAGLSVGAVYRYFKSKDEIINAISQNITGTLGLQLEEIAAAELPLLEAMSRAIDTIDVQVRPGGFFSIGVQVWAEATVDPAIGAIVRQRYLQMRRPFRTIAQHAVARGEVPAGTDPEALSYVLFGMLPSYAVQHLLVGAPSKETYLAGVRALIAA